MNHITLIGRLTKDPELKYIPVSGVPVASFTIAVDRDYKEKDGSTKTDFIPIEIMGNSAEFTANYIGKGRLVAIHGSLRIERYDAQDGTKKTFTKVTSRGIKPLDYDNNNSHSNSNSNSNNSYGNNNDNLNNNNNGYSNNNNNLNNDNGFSDNNGFEPSMNEAFSIDDDDIPF